MPYSYIFMPKYIYFFMKWNSLWKCPRKIYSISEGQVLQHSLLQILQQCHESLTAYLLCLPENSQVSCLSVAEQLEDFQALLSLLPGDICIHDYISDNKSEDIYTLQDAFWASPLYQIILNFRGGTIMHQYHMK